MSAAPHRPLRIALTTVGYPPDKASAGIGTYTKALATGLSECGHRVHVLARSHGADSVERCGSLIIHRLSPGHPRVPKHIHSLSLARFAVTQLAGEWVYRVKLARRLERLIEQERIEVIETPDAFAEGLLFPRHKYPKVPFIVKMHGPLCVYELFDKNLPEWARRFMFRLERRLLLKATHVTVPSQTAGEVFGREMDLKFVPWTLPNPPPIVNAPNGAGESEDPNLVLFVGRIAPVKGIHVLIEAIPRILDVQPDTRFVIAGGEAAADHRFDASKRSLLAKLPEPCQAAVSFTGHLSPDAVVEYYKRASVCVLPSLFDTFAYTCLEAMNYGRAVVGSCNSGMRELLDDGRAGLLYTPPDAVELASQIVRLLREPRLRLKLGDRARERALAEFGKERTLDRTLEFYYRAVTELRTLGQERRATRQSPAHHCNVNPPSR